MLLDSLGGAAVIRASLQADIGGQREVTWEAEVEVMWGHLPPTTDCRREGKGTHTPRDSRRMLSADDLSPVSPTRVTPPAPDGESECVLF